MSKIYFAYYIGLVFGALLALSIRKLINFLLKTIEISNFLSIFKSQDRSKDAG